MDDPRAELCNELTWTYSPAPYVFGEPIILAHLNSSSSYPFLQAYHAVGTLVTLCAICAPQSPSAGPYVIDLASANLRLRRERIVHLRRIIRLSRYIPLLVSLIG
jgi:hypothetical protein